ncbi:cyclic AMP-dependent transcription factor ATF-2 isoform X2 [Orussus abietinus]|nr:cyclic AMP-dependent transcription factor ATF-2 isoform X2 [Orussus abietinus]XP_023290762.1 cyclic AMP-dependent transcription factor ATF-2 isoform X2 [Orussus abietinus]
MVHKKKHDMILNLGVSNRNNAFVADQTPTPTRFIRNCEEVGLFQDLQNVNPFEETFRRAVETGKTGPFAVSEVATSDDTLHTPHVFPRMSDALGVQALSDDLVSASDKKTSETKCSVETRTDTKIHQTTEQMSKDITILTSSTEVKRISETIVIHEQNTLTRSRDVQEARTPQLSINGEEVQLLLKTADGKFMQLSAIQVPESQIQQRSVIPKLKPQIVVIKTEPSLRSISKTKENETHDPRLTLAKMKLKQMLAKSSRIESDKTSEEFEGEQLMVPKERRTRSIDRHKKQELLERNRASSMRARAKRKAWIQQLERTVSNVNETNAALQMEVRALRAEVSKLKVLLLAHKECPVTKAMEKGNGILIGSKVIPLGAETISAFPVATGSVPLKRSTLLSEVPILSKRKPSLATTKTSAILPKTKHETQSALHRTRTVDSTPVVKLVEVGHFVKKRNNAKQILTVENNREKINDSTSRRNAQTEPCFKSECTT